MATKRLRSSERALAVTGVVLGTLLAPGLARASVTSISLGSLHTCAVQADGGLRCWGYGGEDGFDGFGELGYGNTNNIGFDETPFAAGTVPIGGSVLAVSAGFDHTCAILSGGSLRCWGEGFDGQLGYGNTNTLGDNETPASVGTVNVGGPVAQVAAGALFTCALLGNGQVKCFGQNDHGQLGQAFPDLIGDDEQPLATPIPLGRSATQIAAGGAHACALLDNGSIRCWGDGFSGQLGYGNTSSIGDDETPAAAGDVAVGGLATQITAGAEHSCALLQSGTIRCWGANGYGQLGYGNTTPIGDDENPADVGTVQVSLNPNTHAIQVAAGDYHTCALLQTGDVVCWGDSLFGKLGHSDQGAVGDNETPASTGVIDLGGSAVQIAAGGDHTCALLSTGRVRCWGDNTFGQLGYPGANGVGDTISPAVERDVAIESVAVSVPLPRSSGFGYATALLAAGFLTVTRRKRAAH